MHLSGGALAGTKGPAKDLTLISSPQHEGLVQSGSLIGEHRDHLVQVPAGGGPRHAVVTGQRVQGGAVA